MNLFEFTPKKNVSRLGLITGILIIGAAVLMLITVLFGSMSYRWVLQLISIGMLTAGIFVTSRFIMKSYVYAVVQAEDGNDLTVTEIQGRHTITVCRIGMASITEAVVVSKSDSEKHKALNEKIKSGKCKKFNYCADLLEDKYICLLAEECGEPLAIKLSWDESVERLFK